MIPSDPSGLLDDFFLKIYKEDYSIYSMKNTIIMIDAGFLSKVSRKLGEGHYFKYDLLKFSKMLAEKQQMIFSHLFFYNAPPFQGRNPTNAEKKEKGKL